MILLSAPHLMWGCFNKKELGKLREDLEKRLLQKERELEHQSKVVAKWGNTLDKEENS